MLLPGRRTRPSPPLMQYNPGAPARSPGQPQRNLVGWNCVLPARSPNANAIPVPARPELDRAGAVTTSWMVRLSTRTGAIWRPL